MLSGFQQLWLLSLEASHVARLRKRATRGDHSGLVAAVMDSLNLFSGCRDGTLNSHLGCKAGSAMSWGSISAVLKTGLPRNQRPLAALPTRDSLTRKRGSYTSEAGEAGLAYRHKSMFDRSSPSRLPGL